MQYGGTTVNPAGLTANNNLFLASGTGGVLGRYNSADHTTLAAWQTATGVGTASLNADPLYVNPTGTAATVDLHLQSTSPANNAGTPVAAVTIDVDGDVRSPSTPDIGADEAGPSNNADLRGLSLSPGGLDQTFAAITLSYTASIANSVTSVTVNVTKADPNATVAITPARLVVGPNTLTVLVTAQDGTTQKTYTVVVTRAAPPNFSPVAGADSMVRISNTRIAKITKAVLLGNDTDADGDPLTITAVGNALPAGATVVLAGNFVVYTAPTTAAGNGSFTYALSDGAGGHSVTGTVAVTAVSPPPSTLAPNTSGIVVNGSDFVLS